MAQPHSPIESEPVSFGLAGWRGRPEAMGVAHRHNDVELNYLERGALGYRFGGRRVDLAAGEICLFWAAWPHQLVAAAGDPLMHWVTLPLGRFLSWRLPAGLGEAVLRGTTLICPAAGVDGASRIARWGEDLALGGAERRRIVELELEALLRRIALRMAVGAPADAAPPESRRSHAEQMADVIVAGAAGPLSLAEIAGAVGLHPRYATQLFRRAYGVSPMAYLTRHRVARAQELLALTDMGVLEAGLAAGFGSASRFHHAFRAICGCSPGAYRAALRRW